MVRVGAPPVPAALRAFGGGRRPSGSGGRGRRPQRAVRVVSSATRRGAGAPARSAGGAGAGAGGAGGGRGATTVSAALRSALSADASRFRWVAATSGSQSAASIELATGQAVMGIGGFNNEGGNLTLATFERYVAAGDIHYYLPSGGGGAGPGGAGGSSSSIASWVAAHYKAQTIGGQTVYDLSGNS